MENQLHAHVCDICDTRWEHTETTAFGILDLHKCPECCHVQWFQFPMIPDAEFMEYWLDEKNRRERMLENAAMTYDHLVRQWQDDAARAR